MRTYWFEIISEDSEFCGEEFFVEAKTKVEAQKIVCELFPEEKAIKCYGTVTELEAEMMGFDTY